MQPVVADYVICVPIKLSKCIHLGELTCPHKLCRPWSL